MKSKFSFSIFATSILLLGSSSAMAQSDGFSELPLVSVMSKASSDTEVSIDVELLDSENSFVCFIDQELTEEVRCDSLYEGEDMKRTHELTELSPATSYFYKIVAGNGISGLFSFRTLAEGQTDQLDVMDLEVSNFGLTDAQVTFTLEMDARALVRFGPVGSALSLRSDTSSEATMEHEIEIEGLFPGTTYNLIVVAGGQRSERFEFTTPGLPVEMPDENTADMGDGEDTDTGMDDAGDTDTSSDMDGDSAMDDGRY